MARRPRSVPLSRLKGATPARAAICLRPRLPSSGSSAIRVDAVTRPTPGGLSSRSTFSSQIGVCLIVWSTSYSLIASAFCRYSMCALIWRRYLRVSRQETIPFSGEHLDDLAPSGEEGLQLLSLLVGQRTKLRTHGLRKASEDDCVDAIRLGEPAERPPEVADVAGIDCHGWQPGAYESRERSSFQPTCRFQQHQLRCQLLEVVDELDETLVVVT